MKISINEQQLYRLFMGVSIITAFIMLLTFNYLDGQTLMAWSVNNWDLIFEGRPFDFYTDKILNLRGARQIDGMSSAFMLIPQMIWCLPIWITHYTNGNLNVGESIWCNYWYKLFLVVLAGLLAYKVYQMIMRFTGDKTKGMLGLVLITASAELLLSIGYGGQDEIVYLLFIICAFDACMLEKRGWFAFWGTCAVTCCPIALFPIIVMLCRMEKRLLYIIRAMVVMMLPTFLWAIVSVRMENKAELAINSGEFMQKMLDQYTVPLTTGSTSVVSVLAVFLIFAAYFNGNRTIQQDVWYLAATMGIVSFGMENFFYRLFLYIPFFVLLCLVTLEDRNAVNMLLLTVLAYLRIFMSGFERPQTLNTDYVVKVGLIPKISAMTGSTKYMEFDSLTEKMVEKIPILASMEGFFNGIILASVLLLLWINYPKNSKKYDLAINQKIVLLFYTLCMPIYMVLFYGVLFR